MAAQLSLSRRNELDIYRMVCHCADMTYPLLLDGGEYLFQKDRREDRWSGTGPGKGANLWGSRTRRADLAMAPRPRKSAARPTVPLFIASDRQCTSPRGHGVMPWLHSGGNRLGAVALALNSRRGHRWRWTGHSGRTMGRKCWRARAGGKTKDKQGRTR